MTISPDRLAARRRLLVDAAHALIRETGDAGFSMLQLAKRACVSPATPYNLIGSKSELLRLVVQDEFEAFRLKLAAASSPPTLDGLFSSVDLMVRHYSLDRAFYAGLYKAIMSLETEVNGLMLAEGFTLWSGMVQDAIDAGDLEQFVEVEPLMDVFLRHMSATIASWLVFGWTAERFAQESGYAARLLFASVAVPARRAALLDDIRGLQTELLAPGPGAGPDSVVSFAGRG